jgi:hypothetical protein
LAGETGCCGPAAWSWRVWAIEHVGDTASATSTVIIRFNIICTSVR